MDAKPPELTPAERERLAGTVMLAFLIGASVASGIERAKREERREKRRAKKAEKADGAA